MKEYLKMADGFDFDEAAIEQRLFGGCISKEEATYAAHAVVSHDELVAEVERLRRQLACAFMAGWEEGVNGIECDEAEVASVEIAEQFARN